MKISRWPDHPRRWHRDDKKGTHVPLPLDVSQVSDEVVEEMARQYINGRLDGEGHSAAMRAAIAALAAALGEEG